MNQQQMKDQLNCLRIECRGEAAAWEDAATKLNVLLNASRLEDASDKYVKSLLDEGSAIVDKLRCCQ